MTTLRDIPRTRVWHDEYSAGDEFKVVYANSMDDEVVTGLCAATLRDGGVTYSLQAKHIVAADDFWYFPKYPGKTKIVGQNTLPVTLRAFIRENDAALHDPSALLGLWLNPESGKVYLDVVTKLANRDTALAVAQQNSQRDGRQIVSIYNPHRDQTVYL